jgi:NAD(P)-dependent dehydrogenase (short-subunit alcohol dehydrogenase family)
MADLSGQTLLVVGGSSGIGLATARLAAALGADVVLASHDRERLETAASRIQPRARAELADLTDERSIAALCGRLGRIDQLVVTGDQPHAGAIADLDIDDAKQGFDVKFWGSIRTVKHAAPRMPPDGSIVLISGVLAVRPSAGMVTLAALNAAMEGLIRGLAVELSPIRVNGISPGLVDTPSLDWMSAEQRTEMFTAFREATPAKRVGTAEDCASAILMLLTNRFASGEVVRLDGGYAIA